MASRVASKYLCRLFIIVAPFLIFILIVTPSFISLLPSFRGYFYAYTSIQHVGLSKCSSHTNKSSHEPPLSLDFDGKVFPMDHGQPPIYFRDAPWRPKIGRWLSSCHLAAPPIKLIEGLYNGNCSTGCNSAGFCNHELDVCRCILGYTGQECQEKLNLECNHPATPQEPYGHWTRSICPTHCDTMRAFCYCGEGTKYPRRPVAEECGFKQISSTILPDGNKVAREMNWTHSDLDNILTTNKSQSGWCNVDPEEGYSSKVKYKEACKCMYDGFTGKFCEIPTLSTCISQCSGHGQCYGGYCMCDQEWFGVDCSIPSALASVQEWPHWIDPIRIDMPYETQVTKKNGAQVQAHIEKRRPLIYVYDLPSEFDSQILWGRHFKELCVNRIYDENNRTVWTENVHGSQFALYEGLLASPHRTLNANEADYFLVPLLDQCAMIRADDAPYFSLKAENPLNRRAHLSLEYYKKAYNHIVETYPYWNRSSGRDHIWFLNWDESGCTAPEEIRNSIKLSQWGNTDIRHNYSMRAEPADSSSELPSEMRGKYPCFDPEKDIVIPAWKAPDPTDLEKARWKRPQEERKNFFYFRGDLGPNFDEGLFDPRYGMGIKEKVVKEFGSSPSSGGELGRKHMEDVSVAGSPSPTHHDDLSRSIFCGAFPGVGWNGLIEDTILHGCIPVIIQDGILMPFENVLDYDSFSVRIKEEDIPNMITILRKINKPTIESMLANVQSIWPRFFYRDTVLLEAERQKVLHGDVKEWGVEYSKVVEDDVFSTLYQVLHYKLHNDPWRQQVYPKHKNFGLPEGCMRSH